MMHTINSGLIMQAVRKVAQERQMQGISQEEIEYDNFRRSLANNRSIKEFVQELCHSNVGLI